MKVLRARHTIFANALGVKAPETARHVTKDGSGFYGSYVIFDENGNQPGGRIRQSCDEAIARATFQLKAEGGGLLILDGERRRIYVDQSRFIRESSGAYVVYDQDEQRLSSYAVQAEAIEACTDALKAMGGGKITLADGTELTVAASS